LKALAAREPNFQVHFFLTRQLDLLPGEQSGRPDLVAINTLVPNLAQRRVYACGPIGFVRSVEELVKPVSQSFNAESFSPLQIDESLEGEVSVELVASGRTVMVPKGQPLLHALEAQGINPTHGCRMGICKTCVCIKTAGTSQDLLTGVQDSEASDALRICTSSARSDLKLEL